jgi:hypothetical protein
MRPPPTESESTLQNEADSASEHNFSIELDSQEGDSREDKKIV